MSYNILNYPGSTSAERNPYFRTVISGIDPDIIVVQEILSQDGVNEFLNQVLNYSYSVYAAGIFIDGPDTDNAVFYKTDLFTFLNNNVISTALRDINEFILTENNTGDTIRIYSVHLKAGTGSSNEQQRLSEVMLLRDVTDLLPINMNFIVCGDFNIYSSNETAYQELINRSGSGYFIDLFDLPGTWNDPVYAPFHTQSPRTRQFGGGATGGMDDRFDMILMSQAVIDSGSISYVPESFTSYGNDGNHYNDSINRPPNIVVGQQIADALHYASDHLPVLATLSFDESFLEITNFTVLIEGFYNGSSMEPDTVIVQLRNSASPYSLVDEAEIVLNGNGQGSPKFYNAETGIPYYIVVKHRNSVETWSAFPQTFLTSTLDYDFTTSSSKAYGNNLILVGSKWCIYGGDVNQDGFVETSDVNLVFADNVSGVTSYTSTDLNGDMFIEVEDLNIVFINNVLGVQRQTPLGFVNHLAE